MEKKNIAVIFGGVSSEYGVSLQSAAAVLENFPERYNAVPVWITHGGEWFYCDGDITAIREDKLPEGCPRVILPPDRGANSLLLLGRIGGRIPIAAAFPVMHGMGGEDGTLQGLIELTGIPLCGCGTLSSALCMDKERAHKLVSVSGIAVPKSVLIRKGECINPKTLLREIGLPAFVKPLRGGSSYGITRIVGADELDKAIALAFEFDSEIVIEQAISGNEVGCAVMGDRELTIGEPDMIMLSGGFFDFDEKYTLKTSQILCPAPISDEQKRRIKSTAAEIYHALGCSGFARVDMFLTDDNRIVFNEVNTIPGFTPHSRFPGMMRAAGYEFTDIIGRIIDGAVRS